MEIEAEQEIRNAPAARLKELKARKSAARTTLPVTNYRDRRTVVIESSSSGRVTTRMIGNVQSCYYMRKLNKLPASSPLRPKVYMHGYNTAFGCLTEYEYAAIQYDMCWKWNRDAPLACVTPVTPLSVVSRLLYKSLLEHIQIYLDTDAKAWPLGNQFAGAIPPATLLVPPLVQRIMLAHGDENMICGTRGRYDMDMNMIWIFRIHIIFWPALDYDMNSNQYFPNTHFNFDFNAFNNHNVGNDPAWPGVRNDLAWLDSLTFNPIPAASNAEDHTPIFGGDTVQFFTESSSPQLPPIPRSPSLPAISTIIEPPSDSTTSKKRKTRDEVDPTNVVQGTRTRKAPKRYEL
ncbi:hypothetical protein C8R45DRAFT_1147400 [Mycena sanguinolenta]|nr:hypothetical protein C8R45DRAFT_1147400 [Mycena sanguinolenta]